MTTCPIGRDAHPASDHLCACCPPGYPVACVCGGLIHASDEGDSDHKDGQTVMVKVCDRCGADGTAAEPLIIDGEPHSPGRQDCPACRPLVCVCGGLIHISGDDELRRCDRCGGRYEEIDV